jgi:hypothetical protein
MRAKSFALLFSIAALLISSGAAEENLRSDARNPVISHIPREAVGSSVISSVGYSKRRHILEIEFGNGAVYRYLEVPPSVFRELMSAESKARFYVGNIKGNYPSVRVRRRVKDYPN